MSKKKILITIIPLFFIIGLLLNIPIKNTQAITQNLNYSFDNDYIFNSDNLTYETFNIRNQTIITPIDNYTATYDFLDDDITDTGTDISFVDSDLSTGNCYIDLLSSIVGHNYVLRIGDFDEGGTLAVGKNSFSNQEFGTIEFWLLTSSTGKDNTFTISDGATPVIHSRIDTNDFMYYDGSWHNIDIKAISNIWYHVRIDFDCTSGNYKGLSQYEFHYIINGVQSDDYSFWNNQPHIDGLTFQTASADSNYRLHLDSIGYSWNNYDINENIGYPVITTTEIQEIDKCEFDYNITTSEPNDLASYIIDNNWIENDDNNDYIVQTNGLGNGISIDLGMTQLQDYYGISKEFDYNVDNIFNISFDINSMALYNPHLDGWYFNIYSYDDTLLVSLLFELTIPPDISMYYYDGSNYIYIHDIQSLFDFSFNIYINNRVILSLDDNDVIYNWYFPELTSNIGINTIEIISGDNDDIGDLANIEIDSIGFYVNGSSYLPDDLSSIIIQTDIEQWDDSIHNLFGITGNGSFSFSVYYNTVLQDIIISFSTYNSETKTANYLGGSIFQGANPYTFVCISNVSFTISEVYIYAINLKEGANIYLPNIEYNNVDNTANYFYVENNRLSFHVDLNNYSYEGIQATFTIPEISTINGTISFQNYYEGHLIPYLCLNYTYATTDYYEFKNYPNQIKFILPQNKYLYQFIINVSDYIPFQDDNYTNHESGFISGYIQNIRLGYIPDIAITITTIDLITVIIPIMFIFIPSLMFYYGFGKEAVIPAIILFSIIALISNLIQAWVFFVIAYSVFIQLISQRKRLI